MQCSGAIKDDDGNLTIGRFSNVYKIGSQTFEDIYYKHIDDMNSAEKERFKEVEPYYR